MRISDWSSYVCSSDLMWSTLSSHCQHMNVLHTMRGRFGLHNHTIYGHVDVGGIGMNDWLRSDPELTSIFVCALILGDNQAMARDSKTNVLRSEESRVGKDSVSTCSFRWVRED